ncbi:MAG: ribonuclease HII [Anaerolineales bacterium]|nr:ribonuclease HII [Anaerolineales bacterium]
MPTPIRTPAPTLSRERRLLRRGFLQVAGLDEAGRGAWAGPLAAGAVILPLNRPAARSNLSGVRDSKQLTPLQRATAADAIRTAAVAWAVGWASAVEVDRIGPLRATRLAMLRAVSALRIPPDHLLIDYLLLPESDLPQTAVFHGDSLSLSIAAASILAKTWRDSKMDDLSRIYPGYGFDRHKGYGTGAHTERLARLGVCPEHRRSYAPIRRALAGSPV